MSRYSSRPCRSRQPMPDTRCRPHQPGPRNYRRRHTYPAHRIQRYSNCRNWFPLPWPGAGRCCWSHYIDHSCIRCHHHCNSCPGPSCDPGSSSKHRRKCPVDHTRPASCDTRYQQDQPDRHNSQSRHRYRARYSPCCPSYRTRSRRAYSSAGMCH